MISASRRTCLGLLLSAAAFPAGAGAQTAAPPAGAQPPRYLVYFDEFSAYLSPRSKAIINDAANAARRLGARAIIVQARASATGTAQTNQYLALTRSSIVADQLAADGISRSIIRQQPIGQTGSRDPSVYNRRVDIIVER